MSNANMEIRKLNSQYPSAGIKGSVALFFARLWKHRVSYLFIAPFMVCFIVFIVIPVVSAAALAFTYYNVVQPPKFIGWDNFRVLFTEDEIFLKHAVPNTFLFAVIVGPIGYFLSFLLAWIINNVPKALRMLFTISIYVPSIAGGVMMQVVWRVLFSGDRRGYLNDLLINLGILDKPVLWLTDKKYLMGCMFFVSLWSSMGVGFLSMLAGLKNVDQSLYEAAAIDGVRSRLKEIWYITIPAIKPQMLFGAVMAVIGTLRAGEIGVQLSGTNPTPEYAGQLIINHMNEFAYIRYELGYATAISLILLIIIYVSSKFCFAVLGTKEGE